MERASQESKRDEDPADDWTPVLTHTRHLGALLSIQTRVGLLLALVLIGGAILGRYAAGVEDLDVTMLVLLGVMVAGYQGLSWARARQYMDPTPSPATRALLLRMMYGNIVLDYVVLTMAIWVVGGARSPFLPFYVVHAVLSCLLLSRRAAITFHWLAYGLLASLVIVEWVGLAEPSMPGGAVAALGPLDGRYAATVLVVYALLFGLTLFLLLGVTSTLRRSERRMRETNEELRRLSLMRKDFLRIALHNLESPIGVVTMFLGNMQTGLGGELSEQQSDWVERSLERLRGVKGFMHDLQMLSTLESGKIEAQAVELDVPSLLDGLVVEYRDQAEANRQTVTLEVGEDLPPVSGIELLVREAIANYITNAIKYSPSGGRITIRARALPAHVRIEVEDDGIGIAPEDQGRLFTEFVRITRKDTAASDVKGTGLGLSIVKRVATVHGGRVGVESRVSEGSTFHLDLPTKAGGAADHS